MFVSRVRGAVTSVKTPLWFRPTARRASLAVILLFVIAGVVLAVMRDAGTYRARIGSYRVDDPYRIVVYVSLGFADPVIGYDAHEEADRIVLTVRARNRDFGPGTFKQLSASLATPVLVTLNNQIGERAVVDEDGKVVPRTAQDPLCGRG
jgi:hypothetical protein